MLNKIVKYAMWVLMLVGIALTALVFAQNGSETSVNSLLIWAYAMLVIAILAIVYGIIRVVAQEPKKLIRMGAVVVGLVALVVVVYMVCELPLWFKVVVVAVANLIGVFAVKLFEEKKEKEKLWKIECTVSPYQYEDIIECAKSAKIPCNYIDLEKYVVINFYCSTKAQSESVKNFLKNFDDVKYFVSESKVL